MKMGTGWQNVRIRGVNLLVVHGSKMPCVKRRILSVEIRYAAPIEHRGLLRRVQVRQSAVQIGKHD